MEDVVEQQRLTARRALEEICTGQRLEDADTCYRQDFSDHVNSFEFNGLDGVRESVALYRQTFSELQFTVEDQVAQGDRVATRWTMRGATPGGRHVEVPGITISRFIGGRIKEDWTVYDNAELRRQLGA